MSFRLGPCNVHGCELVHSVSAVPASRTADERLGGVTRRSSGKPERFLPPLGSRLLAETSATPEDFLDSVPPVRADGGPTPPSAPSPSSPVSRRRTHLRAVHPGAGRSRRLSGALGPTTPPSG